MENNEKQKFVFESLAPSNDIQLGVYEDVIDHVFDDSSLRNIAISGSFGSGKSSILATYEHKKTAKLIEGNHQFLHISLAHFHDSKEEGRNKKGNQETVMEDTGETVYREKEEAFLEGKIINQLIHQIPDERIPKSTIRKLSSSKERKSFRHSFAITVFIFLGLFFFFGLKVETLLPLKNSLSEIIRDILISSWLRISSFCIWVLLLFYYCFWIIKTFKTRNIFKKLTIKGTEIEIASSNASSFFDKYLNEVTYLFENIDADVVVFEDIDRFEDVMVFERLREINKIVNDRKREGDIPIRFFYLVKDDLLQSRDRTKFFDFIIPAIPVVDGSNSYNKLIVILQNNGILEKMDLHFLRQVSLYIDDMRLLKNICNEFLIYYSMLNISDNELDPNKLFGIIVYKNFYPVDFNELHSNRGIVYSLFNNKPNLVANLRKGLENELAEVVKNLDKCRKEITESKNELDFLFDRYYTAVNKRAEYQERRNQYNNSGEKRTEEWSRKKEELEMELRILESTHLSELLEKGDFDSFYESCINEDPKKNSSISLDDRRLLSYLIRSGYIDETYSDYITFFYPNGISSSDKLFLTSIADRHPKGYEYQIKDPELVFESVHPVDFSNPAILNYDFIRYVIKNYREESLISILVDLIRKNSIFDFVDGYLRTIPDSKYLVKVINSKWPEAFETLLNSQQVSKEGIHLYALYSLLGIEKSDIKAIESNKALLLYIENNSDYLNIKDSEANEFSESLLALKIKIKTLDSNATNECLFKLIAERGLYKLSINNLIEIISFLRLEKPDSIKGQIITIILNNKTCCLYEKLNNEINEFVSVILGDGADKINDSEEAVLYILNHSQLTLELKRKYIKQSNTILSSLSTINDKTIQKVVFGNRKIAFSSQNVFYYFQLIGSVDENLVDFINSSDEALDFSFVGDESQLSSFCDAVLTIAEKVNINQFVNAFKNLPGNAYDSFNKKGVPDQNMYKLIDLNVIKYNHDTLTTICNYYSDDVLKHYARNDSIAFVKIVQQETSLLKKDKLEAILSDLGFPEDNKIRLIETLPFALQISNKEYPPSVQKVILDSRFDEADYPYIFKKYSSFEADVQEVIRKRTKEYLASHLEAIGDFDSKLAFAIIMNNEIEKDKRIALLTSHIIHFDKDMFSRCTISLGLLKYPKVFIPNARPFFEKTSQNVDLLNAIKEKGWIEDYYETQGGKLSIRHISD